MQEEIEQKSFNVMISTTKLSARTVLRAVKAAIRLYQSKASQGRQSVRTLLRQNRGVSSVEISKTGKKEIEEDFNESIQQQFDDSDNITDKGIADYAEKLTEVKKLAKYKVQDVKEEDGVYTVSVQVEPSNVFQTLQQSSTEVSNEKIKQGLDGNDPEVFAAVLTESVQKSLEKNRYGKAVTVNVSVEKDNSGKYGLLDTEMNKLEAAMFPTE